MMFLLTTFWDWQKMKENFGEITSLTKHSTYQKSTNLRRYSARRRGAETSRSICSTPPDIKRGTAWFLSCGVCKGRSPLLGWKGSRENLRRGFPLSAERWFQKRETAEPVSPLLIKHRKFDEEIQETARFLKIKKQYASKKKEKPYERFPLYRRKGFTKREKQRIVFPFWLNI